MAERGSGIGYFASGDDVAEREIRLLSRLSDVSEPSDSLDILVISFESFPPELL